MYFDIKNHCFRDLDNNPKELAIAGSDGDLTWDEFKQLSSQISSRIKSLMPVPNSPVVIYGHKEKSYIATVAACMMAEIPYVPVDCMLPKDRINSILTILNCHLLINCSADDPSFEVPVTVNLLDDRVKRRGVRPFVSDSEPSATDDDPIIYIIFTSGTTGKPKGVQITRKAVCSFLSWIDSEFGFSSSEVFMNQAPFSFDLSVYELMTVLHTGGALVLCDSETAKSSDQLVNRIAKYRCTTFVSTPSFVSLPLLERSFCCKELPNLKTFLFCGETLPNKTAKSLLLRFPRCRILNSYGPTEATVATAMVNITPEILDRYPELPVGVPKSDSRIYIDESKNPLRNGTGEILIVGDNVSIGYYHEHKLNSDKFFSDENGMRGFRTGDLGHFNDGMLFFDGRLDDQVKLHGFRIELDDIDNNILLLNYVMASTTIALKRNGSVKKLVSFVVFRETPPVPTEKGERHVRDFLQTRLPPYMVPSEIRVVKALPHNANHKVDKRLLEQWAISPINCQEPPGRDQISNCDFTSNTSL